MKYIFLGDGKYPLCCRACATAWADDNFDVDSDADGYFQISGRVEDEDFGNPAYPGEICVWCKKILIAGTEHIEPTETCRACNGYLCGKNDDVAGRMCGLCKYLAARTGSAS